METKNMNIATVNARSLPISTKMSVEVCNFIRNKDLNIKKIMLKDIVLMKKALPVKRYNHDLSHKPGMAAGRYPIKATTQFIKLLNSLEKNAENKGLNTKNLIITFAKSNKAERRWKSTRKGRTSG